MTSPAATPKTPVRLHPMNNKQSIQPKFLIHADKHWALANLVAAPIFFAYISLHSYTDHPKSGVWYNFILFMIILIPLLYRRYRTPTLQIFDGCLVGYKYPFRNLRIIPFSQIKTIGVKYGYLILFSISGERILFKIPKNQIEACKQIVADLIIPALSREQPDPTLTPGAIATCSSLHQTS